MRRAITRGSAIMAVVLTLSVLVGLAAGCGSSTDDQDMRQSNEAVRLVGKYYEYLNEGDARAMYDLIAPESPIKKKFGYETFSTQVGEAHNAGLMVAAESTADDFDDTGPKAKVDVLARYSGYKGMEGQDIPAKNESFTINLVKVDGRWYIDEINSKAALW